MTANTKSDSDSTVRGCIEGVVCEVGRLHRSALRLLLVAVRHLLNDLPDCIGSRREACIFEGDKRAATGQVNFWWINFVVLNVVWREHDDAMVISYRGGACEWHLKRKAGHGPAPL